METIPLEPVDSVTITTLVDNVADLLLPNEGPAQRRPSALSAQGAVPARFLEGGTTGDTLRAELLPAADGDEQERVAHALARAGLRPARALLPAVSLRGLRRRASAS
jgi:hypothetical protein